MPKGTTVAGVFGGADASQSTGVAPASVGAGTTVSVVVPTRNEAENVGPLLARIGASCVGLVSEVIVVDDSSDATPDAVRAEIGRHPFAVRLIARPPERRNGLGMAVVEGIGAAQGEWVCVMDGDLQHPPEVVPQLLDRARERQATLVAASRLTDGGGTEGLSAFRRLLSYVLALVSRLLFPRSLRELSDPLTGFFLVRRDRVDPDRLRPEGFKILLELVVRSPQLVVSEIPFEFGKRVAGTSKASGAEMAKLFRQMVRLSLSARSRLLRFAAVGGSGIVVNTAIFAFAAALMGGHYLLAAVVATQGSTLWNFVLSETWVFPDRARGARWARLVGYAAMNNALLVPRGPLLLLLMTAVPLSPLVANVVSILVIFVLRYLISDRLIWRGRPALSMTAALIREPNVPAGEG
ncbi:MAG: glycosyltransferase family 2 protein [Deinococcales bacterium]